MTVRLELGTWARVRRYAVPQRMIERCAEARERGDWRAACAAGNVEIDFDLTTVAGQYGGAVAERIEADLLGLAPDLLRWHLPRALGGRTSLATGQVWALSTSEGSWAELGATLAVRLPFTVDGSQALRLEVLPVDVPHYLTPFDLPPHLWHTEHAPALLAAYGGSSRLPRFTADGKRLSPPAEAPAREIAPAETAADGEAGPGGEGLTERSERVLGLLEGGRLYEAWEAAGVPLDLSEVDELPRWQRTDPSEMHTSPFDLLGLAAEMRRLARRHGTAKLVIGGYRMMMRLQVVVDGDRVSAAVVSNVPYNDRSYYRVGSAAVTRPADPELLWHGLISGAELHPLVRQALLPGAGERGREAEPVELTARTRVRCRGEWHWVEHREGDLRLDAHTEAEAQREAALRSLGGEVAGCFHARQVWRGAPGRLPKALHRHQLRLAQLIQHGDAQTVLDLLDRGMDPRMRDARGRSLLHWLRALDHTELLPRLVAGGLPIDTPDHRGRTAMHVAVGDGGTAELVLALLRAGASPHAQDQHGTSVLELAGYKTGDYEDEENEDASPNLRAIKRILEEWAGQ